MISAKNSGGVYDKTLIHPDLNDFAPRVGFAYAIDPKTSLRGGYGVGYIHYTRAGPGDLLAINAPQSRRLPPLQASAEFRMAIPLA